MPRRKRLKQVTQHDVINHVTRSRAGEQRQLNYQAHFAIIRRINCYYCQYMKIQRKPLRAKNRDVGNGWDARHCYNIEDNFFLEVIKVREKLTGEHCGFDAAKLTI